MRQLEVPIIACSIGERHLHALTNLPSNYQDMKKLIGKSKQKASHSVRYVLPGIIWEAGCEFNRIKDRDHLHNTYKYIRTKQELGTVVWSHKPQENWIDVPAVGIVVMGRASKQMRVFPLTHDAGV
jgi:REP element-mobilizing transposase RayT